MNKPAKRSAEHFDAPPVPGSAAWAQGRLRDRRLHRRGAVMVITLLATLLLAGLVFYVFNLGRQTQARLVTQHSADAAVMTGSGWVARTMNTVAMNNVTMVRLLAMVQVLDSLPEAVGYSLTDQQSLAQIIDRQLNRPITESYVREYLEQVAEEVAREIDMLTPLDNLLNQTGQAPYYDVRLMTLYDGPVGRGELWLAMESLDEFSQTAVENMGVLAKLNAYRGGRVNLQPDSQATGVMLLPLIADLPVQRGRFDDFERPMRYGLLPADVDDPVTNRGPYDAVFGHRDRYPTLLGRQIDGRGGVGIGQPGGDREVTRPATGYRVIGPLTQMLRHFTHTTHSHLRHSQFNRRLNNHARIKVSHLWPPASGRQALGSEWIIDYQQTRNMAENQRSRIRQTRFVAIEIKSQHPRHHPSFMAEGTWAHVRYRHIYSPRAIYANGWVDPETWDQATQTGSHIWLDAWTYNVNSDPSIGLMPSYDEQGESVSQTVYRYDHYVFAGINVAEPVTVTNPNNFASREDLPAPMDLIHDQLPHDDAFARQQHLNFMAVAHQDDRAMLWPGRFTSGKPTPFMAAMAQAYIFNDHSWDLWTQMWQTQLRQVTLEDYDYWIDHLQAHRHDVDWLPMLQDDHVDLLYRYLRSIEPLARVMLDE